MKSLFRSMLGLAAVGVLGLMLGQGTTVGAADEKTDGAQPTEISAGTGTLEAVKIKLPKPAYIGTPKNLPTGVRKPYTKPRVAFMAPAGTTNLSVKCPVTSSDKEPIIGKLEQITDGDKEGIEGNWVELAPSLQWVQIDLGKAANIYGICVWHHHADPRVYKAVVVQISDDPDFINNVKTIFNNDKTNSAGLGLGTDWEYVESYEGELMPIKTGAKGRYVRLYSKGNTTDDQNHYTEIEVYGVAAK